MSFGDMASIGTATGSRVDSAAKHIMACKVDSRILQNWIDNAGNVYDKENKIHTDKMKWCMHKDEIVLNTTKKKDNSDSAAKGYPMVVTTLGDISKHTITYIQQLYAQPTISLFYKFWKCKQWDEFRTLQGGVFQAMPTEDQEIVNMQIKTLPEFRCQGVALGQAWASYLSGDTVASVLVGGMMTVLNGHFPMHTGDEVQWYFDFEQDLFECGKTSGLGAGFRKLARNTEKTKNQTLKKDVYMDQKLYGGNNGIGRSNGLKQTDKIVRVKSYRMHLENNIFMSDHYGDKSRVFAKCISGGRPFDAVDIMIMTQSS